MEEGLDYIIKQPEVIWFFIGLALMLSEFILPGIIIIFFGLGCWSTSVVLMVFPGISLTIQLIIFLSSSILLLILLRNKAKEWIGKASENRGNDEFLEEFIGKKGIALSPIKAGGSGQINFKGTLWEADSAFDIAKGDPVRIVSKISIKLTVEPIN